MSDRELLKMALEALENCRIEYDYHGNPIDEENANLLKSIDTLRAALAEPVKAVNKTPAWWMDGLAATLMREGVNKHRAREIAQGYWEAYCQIPGQEEVPR